MIDFKLPIDYRTSGTYADSIVKARVRLGHWDGTGFVLKDRSAENMSRIGVEIIDEHGQSEIEVLLMGDTLYVLGATLRGGQQWTVCKNQNKEFGSCKASITGQTEFESGYGALGVSEGSGTPAFSLNDCSRHVSALKGYVETAAEKRTEEQINNAKLAFAYFAMTVGESIRFRSICARLCIRSLDPSGVLPELQGWVVDSTVKESAFPSRIAVYGIHEKTNSVLFKRAMEKMKTTPKLAPGLDEYKKKMDSSRHSDVENLMKWIDEKKGKVGDAALTALRSSYFKSRLNRAFLINGLDYVISGTKKRNISANNFSNVDGVLTSKN